MKIPAEWVLVEVDLVGLLIFLCILFGSMFWGGTYRAIFFYHEGIKLSFRKIRLCNTSNLNVYWCLNPIILHGEKPAPEAPTKPSIALSPHSSPLPF